MNKINLNDIAWREFPKERPAYLEAIIGQYQNGFTQCMNFNESVYEMSPDTFAASRIVRWVPFKPIEDLANCGKGKFDFVSDGYHTFDEIYRHRYLLMIALCLSNEMGFEDGRFYWVKEHAYEMDLLVFQFDNGHQISFHVPTIYRYLYNSSKQLDISEYKYDGHSSEDVCKRLVDYCIRNEQKYWKDRM